MSMKFLLVKSSLVSCQDAHFAGGKHAFLCLAKALAAHGQEVHTFSFGDKTSVMMYLAMNGFLVSMVASKASEGVITWRHNSITHHVAFTDHQASDQLDITALSLGRKARRHCPAHARLLDHAAWAIPSSQQLRVIMDADESQTGSSDEQMSLFEAVVQRWSHRVLPMVQNVHFLPFGPSGTSVRTKHLLDAWSQAGPVICVSTFVASYLQSHGQSARLVSERLWVTPLTAFQVFGSSADVSSCADLGSQRATELRQGTRKPVVGMLKLTPEKGAAILAACARALPSTTFLAVSGDPAAQQLQRELPNVHIMPPQADIEDALKHMTLVITPSLWLEAFGMVVVEAMLRGLPVVVSDAGALPEAGLGVAPVVPVQHILIPAEPQTGAPSWALRSYPSQEVGGWVQAIQSVMGDAGKYAGLSAQSRSAALEFVQRGEQEWGRFLARCEQLG